MSYNDPPLIHPSLMQELTRTHYPSRVTLQNATATYDGANEKTETWANIGSLTSIAAYIEPVLGNQEVRRADQTIVTDAYNISLAGYYPTITEGQRIIDDHGKIYNIISASVDDFSTHTIIVAERVNDAS
jgi:head-tail adaptor